MGWTIGNIKQRNKDCGKFYFEPDTMRFFKSRVSEQVYEGPGGIFFVTSERGPSDVRAYTARRFNPKTGDVSTAGPFNTMSRQSAHLYAKKRAAQPAAEDRAPTVDTEAE